MGEASPRKAAPEKSQSLKAASILKNTPFLSSNIWKLQRNSMDSMKDFNNEEYKTGRDDVLICPLYNGEYMLSGQCIWLMLKDIKRFNLSSHP